jgi:hypothetical protein
MRIISTLLIAIFVITSGFSQKNVYVQLETKMGEEAFVLDNIFTREDGTSFQPKRLQYYISKPIVIHDGGLETAAPNRYFLVNGGQTAPLDLGLMNVNNVEGIKFSVGVDSASNHLDPALYDSKHPLAYQNPSMHWGWVSGYRFIAYEGKSGNNLVFIYEIHTIGNELFRNVVLSCGATTDGDDITIPIEADYGQLLKDIDVSGGLYAHGNLNEAVTISDNMANHVFTSLISSNDQPDFSTIQLELAPNPSGYHTNLKIDLPEVNKQYLVSVTNALGQKIFEQSVGAGQNNVELIATQSGLHLVQVWSENQLVGTKKWLVIQ